MTKYAPQLRSGLIAGFIAITINTLVLKAAPLLGIQAESGGLLKLLMLHLRSLFAKWGLAGWLPDPHGLGLWIGFHYLTGFGMVFLYVFLFQPLLPGKGWLKGSVFSLLPWLINSTIVLPLLGQGWLGMHQLPVSGIVYFFVANWLFGASLGFFYEKLFGR